MKRPEFTQAEILRSNLAAVILRMMVFELGDIETFPFIDPPSARAIASGYQLLVELGALKSRERGAKSKEDGSNYVLTALGKKLAHLPVDPTVGRMIWKPRRSRPWKRCSLSPQA